MENKEDTIRVKEEPNDTWPDLGEDYNFDSEISCEVKNFKTSPFHESPANRVNEDSNLPKKSEENIYIGFEFKYVKPELKPLSKKNCKTEYQTCLPLVKLENKIQTSHLIEKSPIILIKKNFDYDNRSLFQGKSRLKLNKSKKVEIINKKIKTKLSHNLNLRQKTYKGKATPEIPIDMTHESIRPPECETCHKSFSRKGNLNKHTRSVHDQSKPFECNICHKTFGQKSYLNKHINAVHNQSKPFECEICYKSFGKKSNFNRHINAVHKQSKPFECDICQKSFGYQNVLKSHKMMVHNRSKPFECEICKKTLGQKDDLNHHINAVHVRSKPFECEICHKSFGKKGNFNRHINAVHKQIKPFECDICQKSFGYQNVLKSHKMTVHNRIKPFECEICQKSFGQKGDPQSSHKCSTYKKQTFEALR